MLGIQLQAPAAQPAPQPAPQPALSLRPASSEATARALQPHQEPLVMAPLEPSEAEALIKSIDAVTAQMVSNKLSSECTLTPRNVETGEISVVEINPAYTHFEFPRKPHGSIPFVHSLDAFSNQTQAEHPFPEEQAFIKAFELLQDPKTSQCVVSFQTRKGGERAYEPSGKPMWHSVVISKQQDDRFAIVDPTVSKFSIEMFPHIESVLREVNLNARIVHIDHKGFYQGPSLARLGSRSGREERIIRDGSRVDAEKTHRDCVAPAIFMAKMFAQIADSGHQFPIEEVLERTKFSSPKKPPKDPAAFIAEVRRLQLLDAERLSSQAEY